MRAIVYGWAQGAGRVLVKKNGQQKINIIGLKLSALKVPLP
jgi:hypothetical protein